MGFPGDPGPPGEPGPRVRIPQKKSGIWNYLGFGGDSQEFGIWVFFFQGEFGILWENPRNLGFWGTILGIWGVFFQQGFGIWERIPEIWDLGFFPAAIWDLGFSFRGNLGFCGRIPGILGFLGTIPGILCPPGPGRSQGRARRGRRARRAGGISGIPGIWGIPGDLEPQEIWDPVDQEI